MARLSGWPIGTNVIELLVEAKIRSYDATLARRLQFQNHEFFVWLAHLIPPEYDLFIKSQAIFL